MDNILKSSEEWLKEYPGLIIMDPDGWNRASFVQSWTELITKKRI